MNDINDSKPSDGELTPPPELLPEGSGESSAEPDEGSLQYLINHWSAFTLEDRKGKFQTLNRTDAEELFFNLKPYDQAALIQGASLLEKRSWIRLLAPDDVADVIQESDAETRPEMLSLLDSQTRREVTALLAYAEDKAGGLMSSRFVRLRPDMSVDEAISYLRIQAKSQIEIIYYCYVISPDQVLDGVVSLRELFSVPPHKKIHEIMTKDIVKIPVGLDQESVAKIFAQNDFLALPVIDEWDHIKGIVTFDDVANVIQEEATEDIQKLGAVQALEAPYLQVDFLELLQKRGVWLIILFFGEMLTATAMAMYFKELEKAVVLSIFIPLIISAGGNAGSQASTLIIRALALGEVRMKDWVRILYREAAMGLVLGLGLGLLGLVKVLAGIGIDPVPDAGRFALAVTIALSVLSSVTWGTLAGSMLPLILKNFKVDPATASAPFVATLVDVTGLVIYFTVARIVLGGTLL